MFDVVEWGLPKGGLASNTVKSQDRVFSVQIPRDPSSLEVKVDGDMTEQAHSVFSQLKTAMEAAGGTLADVAQLQIFIVEASEAAAMNAVYKEYFSEPYPNRATVVVKELLRPNMKIEIVVQACLGGN